jgi:hypothetical protein
MPSVGGTGWSAIRRRGLPGDAGASVRDSQTAAEKGGGIQPNAVLKWLFVAATLALAGSEALACSGPGAAKAIRQSELIGTSSAGLSIAVVAAGCSLLLRRSLGGRLPWIAAPLVLHPRWWMDAVHGDCGATLCFWSLVATVGIAINVALAARWPRPAASGPRKASWLISGALAGALAGLVIAALVLEGPGWSSVLSLPLAGAVLGSAVALGILASAGLFQLRTERRLRFRLRTLALLPFALAPLFVALLPVLPYEASVSTTRPFHFLIVDDATGRPVPDATVQLIDPRFPPDDAENQGERVVTGPDGTAPYYLFANVRGREGLLGRTETTSYHPWLVRVEARGYRLFFTSLAAEAPVPAKRLSAPPLGLTFPPPPSATIRLRAK